MHREIAFEVLRLAKEVLSAGKSDYEYRYDPRHESAPPGPGWDRTESGWKKGEEEEKAAPPGKKPEKKSPQQPVSPEHDAYKKLKEKTGSLYESLKSLEKVDSDDLYPQEKDNRRVYDIIKKSLVGAGRVSKDRVMALTQRMANAIKDPSKAYRRGLAFEDKGRQEEHTATGSMMNEAANIFMGRARQLLLEKHKQHDAASVPQKSPGDMSPDEVEDVLKKKMGPSYKPQQQRIKEQKEKAPKPAPVAPAPTPTPPPLPVKRVPREVADAISAEVSEMEPREFIGLGLVTEEELYPQGENGDMDTGVLEDVINQYTKDNWDDLVKEHSAGAEAPEPPSPAKPLKKTKPSVKSLNPVRDILRQQKLSSGSAEVQELSGFKKGIMNHQRLTEEQAAHMKKEGTPFWPRNATKLKAAFLKNMSQSNYDSPEAFRAAKEHIDKMPVNDFAKVLAAIMSEDEEGIKI
jgi:hypothetical protein